jgi:uncharacterized protein YjbI with pentapeptide repeats
MRIHKPADAMLLLGRQSRGGQPSLTVTVAYCCNTDGTRLSEQDAWAWLAAQFADDPFDLAQKKSRGGYGVAGDACAPAGSQVTGLTVRAGVGALQKSVLVLGDRYWTRGLTGWQASAPQAFARMPIGPARAYGGKGYARNPLGRGYCADPERADGVALPNVERPEAPVLRPSDTPAPALLGPLPQGSPDQARWLGTLDKRWQRARLPWLPDDTDPRWFDRFEQDQCRQGYWRGDEAWFVENMHPRHPVLRGTLPGLRPRALLRGEAAPERRSELPLDLDTVWLFPNEGRVLVMYRGEAAVRREDAEDILGVAVFTETLAEPAQPAEHWAAVWRQSDEAREQQAQPAQPATPVPDAAAQSAKIEAAMAAAAQAGAAHKAAVAKTIADTRAAAIAEADQAMQAYGFTPLSTRLAQAGGAPAGIAVPTPVWPTDPIAFKAAVYQHVADALAAAEAEVRAEWEKYGGDFDAALARAKAQPPMSQDPADLIANLRLAPEKKAELMKRYQAFQAKMAGVQAKAAEISLQAGQLRAQGQEPAPRPLPDGSLPPGPRTPLDRDALLARHAAGTSAKWCELQGLDLAGVDLSGLDLSRCVLRACVLRGANLEGVDFTECQLEDCDFSEARLGKARFTRARLTGCQAIKAAMPAADFSEARLEKTVFAQADLTGTRWTTAQLKACDFERAALREAQACDARFKDCRFPGTDAAQARFDKAMFDKCILQDANLDDAVLQGATLMTCQAAGARFEGARMTRLRTLKGTDLRQANLNRADLDKAVLQDTDLSRAKLRETHMERGFIKNCDLSGTDAWHLVARDCQFSGGRIEQASWRGANLMKARMNEVVLHDVDLTGANLHAADTRTATVQGLQLEQALLTRCRLLEDYARE